MTPAAATESCARGHPESVRARLGRATLGAPGALEGSANWAVGADGPQSLTARFLAAGRGASLREKFPKARAGVEGSETISKPAPEFPGQKAFQQRHSTAGCL